MYPDHLQQRSQYKPPHHTTDLRLQPHDQYQSGVDTSGDSSQHAGVVYITRKHTAVIYISVSDLI